MRNSLANEMGRNLPERSQRACSVRKGAFFDLLLCLYASDGLCSSGDGTAALAAPGLLYDRESAFERLSRVGADGLQRLGGHYSLVSLVMSLFKLSAKRENIQ
jgi:hypothetical protein